METPIQLKKLLILDLDGTLIYAQDKPVPNADFVITNGIETYWVKKRPYLDEFLVAASESYNLAIWSASPRWYVDAIVKTIISTNIKLEYIYSGERCISRYPNWFAPSESMHSAIIIKDLQKIWHAKSASGQYYSRDNTLILDDTPSTYTRNYGNAIPIEFYTGSKTDAELERVQKILQSLQNVSSVRYIEKRSR